jgi:hypothetical protein
LIKNEKARGVLRDEGGYGNKQDEQRLVVGVVGRNNACETVAELSR